MRGLRKLMLVELKLFLREPETFFFTLIFPMVMLFVFGSIYGNKPVEIFGGRGTVDISVPAYMGLIIAVTGLMSIPISTATDREKGVLRRLRATPVRLQTILIARIMMYFVMTLVGALLLVAAGKIVYGLRFDGNALYVFLAFIISALSFFALGFVIASLAPTGRTANIVGMALFFPMIFFSGATIPWNVLPDGVQMVGRALPLTYVVKLLQGLWFAEPWNEHLLKVAVLAGMLIVGVVVSAKIFRWE
ncbi:ABC transporter permease [Candidatus Poribacteria bacterium]|nr:ABC transporter permease [Candidatus Poribacteria bacterium]